MSAVVTKPTRDPGTDSTRQALRVWRSTVGLKLIMAATGVVLSAFVLGHMAGNLQIFQGARAIDDYSELLHKEPAVLWGARLVLLGSVGLHIWAWLVLFRRNLRSRPEGYRMVKHQESNFASRSMRVTGPLVLAFLVFHILHLTTGSVHPDYHAGSVYRNLVAGLRVVPVALIYVLAMVMLGFHTWHGVWSMTQTLGGNQPRYRSLGRRAATVFTLVVVAGFSAVPLAIVAGLVK